MIQYQQLTEGELLQLTGERLQLTDEARLALDTEISRRKISSLEIESFKVKKAALEKAEKQRLWRIHYIPNFGFGTKFLGKSNRRRDPGGLFEEYDATLWFVVLWVPLFPIATYTGRRDLERWLGMTVAGEETPLQRHPRNWEQILLTWVKTAAILFVAILVFPLLRRLHR